MHRYATLLSLSSVSSKEDFVFYYSLLNTPSTSKYESQRHSVLYIISYASMILMRDFFQAWMFRSSKKIRLGAHLQQSQMTWKMGVVGQRDVMRLHKLCGRTTNVFSQREISVMKMRIWMISVLILRTNCSSICTFL